MLQVFILLLLIGTSKAVTSPIVPYTTYNYSIELKPNVAYLFWTANEKKQEITFELHINTTGWIALGISPGKTRIQRTLLFYLGYDLAGGMIGADIGVGWVDGSGKVHFEVGSFLFD